MRLIDADVAQKIADEELFADGNASSAALMAQKELVRRNGGAVAGHHFDGLYFLSDDSHERFTKKFKCKALEDV